MDLGVGFFFLPRLRSEAQPHGHLRTVARGGRGSEGDVEFGSRDSSGVFGGGVSRTLVVWSRWN